MTGRNWWPCRAAERLALGVLLATSAALGAAAGPACAGAAAAADAASAPASAASGDPVAPAGGEDVGRFAEGTFWRLTSPQGRVSHLLGTIHIGQALELGVPAEAWAALRGARRLVVELASDEVPPAQLDSLQRLPPPHSLAGPLTPAELALLQRRLARAGLALKAPLRYRPWVLAQLLQAAAPLTLQTLDDRLVWLARRQRIEVVSLETLPEQYAAFDCIGPAEQVLLLKDTLAMQENFFDAINRESLALYRAQRTGELVTMLDRRFPVSEAARAVAGRASHCIVDQRNARFAQRLLPLLADDAVFAAIGSAHLVGAEGVLARLARVGFRAERVAAGSGAAAAAAPPAASTAPAAAPAAGDKP
ncbi:MAG: TraB/GumN family protein [Burkholderiales bacterium]|nr:TraB/GumN family protein [Burkholderiales bacterium]